MLRGPSGEAYLGLGVCPCGKDGQLDPGLFHKILGLWRSSCSPPAQSGSAGEGPTGLRPFAFFSISKDGDSPARVLLLY